MPEPPQTPIPEGNIVNVQQPKVSEVPQIPLIETRAIDRVLGTDDQKSEVTFVFCIL